MFNIAASELDGLRVKLLAAITSGAIDGDAAQHALEAAEHLSHLSAWIEGDSHILVDSHFIAGCLKEAAGKLHP
jgi:hypothetical protein